MEDDFWAWRQRQQQQEPDELDGFQAWRQQQEQAQANATAGIALPPDEASSEDRFQTWLMEKRQRDEAVQIEEQKKQQEYDARAEEIKAASSHRQYIGESLKSWGGSFKEAFDVPVALGKAGLERLSRPDFSGFDTPTGLNPLEQPATAEPMVPGWDAEGGGFDDATAARYGMQPDETGHMGSVVPVSPREVEKGVPEGSYRMLKGKGHPTWDKAVEAEEARGFQIKKIGDNYYSVPLTAGLEDRPEIQQDVTGMAPEQIQPGAPEALGQPEAVDRVSKMRQDLGLGPGEAPSETTTKYQNEHWKETQAYERTKQALVRNDSMRQALLRLNHEAGLTDAEGKLNFDEAFYESFESSLLGKPIAQLGGAISNLFQEIVYSEDLPSYSDKLAYIRRLRDNGQIDENLSGYMAGAMAGVVLDVWTTGAVFGGTSLAGPTRDLAVKMFGGRGAKILATGLDGFVADVVRANRREDEGPGTVLAGIVAGAGLGAAFGKPMKTTAEMAAEDAASKALRDLVAETPEEAAAKAAAPAREVAFQMEDGTVHTIPAAKGHTGPEVMHFLASNDGVANKGFVEADGTFKPGSGTVDKPTYAVPKEAPKVEAPKLKVGEDVPDIERFGGADGPVEMVPLRDLNPEVAAASRDPARVQALAEEIKQSGRIDPVVLGPNGELLNGGHRLAALDLLGVEEVPVVRAKRGPKAVDTGDLPIIKGTEVEPVKAPEVETPPVAKPEEPKVPSRKELEDERAALERYTNEDDVGDFDYAPGESPRDKAYARMEEIDRELAAPAAAPKATVAVTPAQRRVLGDAGIKAGDMKDITPEQAIELRHKLDDANIIPKDSGIKSRIVEKLRAVHESGGLDYAESAAAREQASIAEKAAPAAAPKPKAAPEAPVFKSLSARLADARLYRKTPVATRLKQLVEAGMSPEQAKRVDDMVIKDSLAPQEAVDKIGDEVRAALKEAEGTATVKAATPAQKKAVQEATDKITKPKPKATPEQKAVIDEAKDKVTKRQVTKADDYEDTGVWEVKDPDGTSARITYDKAGMKGTWSVVDEAGNKTALSATKKADAIEEALDLARKGADDTKTEQAVLKGRDAKGRKKPKTKKPVSEDQIPSRKAAVEDPKVSTKEADQLSFLDEGGYAINLLDDMDNRGLAILMGSGVIGAGVAGFTSLDDRQIIARSIAGFSLGIGIVLGGKGVVKLLNRFGPRAKNLRIGLTPGGRLAGIIKEWNPDTLRDVQDAIVAAHGGVAEGQRMIARALGDLHVAAAELYGGGANRFTRTLGVTGKKSPFANVPADVAENINAALHKGVDSAEWAAMPEQFKDPLLKMRTYISELSQAFIDEGIVQGDLAIKFDRDSGLYVTRSFRIYTDPEWYANAPKILGQENWDQIVKDWRDWFIETIEPINKNREYANWALRNRKLDFEDFKEAFGDAFQGHGLTNKQIRSKYKLGNRFGIKEFAINNKGLNKKDFAVAFRKEFPDSNLSPKKVDGYRKAAASGDLKKAELDLVPLDDEALKQAYYAFMDKGNSVTNGIKYGKMGKIAGDILKRRNTKLAVPVQKLWGVNDDAFVNFAVTVSKQNETLASWRLQETLKEIGTRGLMDAEGNMIPGFLVKLDETGQIPSAAREKMFKWKVFDSDDIRYRPLKGYAMPLEVFNELDQLGKGPLGDNLTKAFMALSGASKVSKTVLSWVTQVRNLTGNTSIAMANGLHAQFARSMASEDGLVTQSFRDVLQGLGWMDTPGGNEKFVRSMIKLGIMDESANAAELYAAIKAIGIETKVKDMPAVLSGTKSAAASAFNLAAGIYRSGDDVWKVMAFKMERDRYKAALKATGEFMSDEALDKHVAKIVRRTWPTFSMVPDYVQQWRRWGGFISFPAEMYRSTAGIISQASEEMASSNPAIRRIGQVRAIGLASTLTIPFALAATSRMVTGVSHEEEDAMRTVLPYWSRNSTLIQTQKLHNGKFGVFDASYLLPQSYFTDPINALMRGEQVMPTVVQMLKEVTEPFLQPSPVVTEVIKALQKQDDAPNYSWPVPMAVVKAMTPGTIDQFLRVATGMTAGRQPLSRWKEGIAMATGVRGSTVDVRDALGFQAWAFKNELQKQDDEFVKQKRKGGINRLPFQEELWLPAVERRVASAQREVWRRMFQFVAAVQTLGVSEQETRRILREAKISREHTNLLIKGAAAGVREKWIF